jgi:isopenicillin N synthase-like dioxygenase
MNEPYRWRLEDAARRAKTPLQGANREHNWALGQLRRARMYASAQMSDITAANALEKLFAEELALRQAIFEQVKTDIQAWKEKQDGNLESV